MNKILLTGTAIFIFFLGFVFTVFPSVTEANQSVGWTIQTLKEHYDYVMKERDAKIDQKFESLELAVLKAEQATEKRFEGVNEFRNTLADQQRTFIPRAEYEAGHASLTDQVTEIKGRMDKLESMRQGGNVTFAYLVSGISLLVALIALSRNFLASIYRKSKET